MGLRIIIKFRTDLWINEALPYVDNYSLPKGYFQEVDTYHINSYYRNFKYNRPYFVPGKFQSAFLQQSKDVETAIYDQWNKLHDYLIVKKNLFPEFLFRYNRIETTNEFWLYDYKNVDPRGAVWSEAAYLRPVPNLYNYFELKLPETHNEKDAIGLLDSLITYLPYGVDETAGGYGVTQKVPPAEPKKPYLLEYAYLQTDPVIELGLYSPLPVYPLNSGNYKSNPPRATPPAPGNQDYLKYMSLNLTPNYNTGLGVGVSIVENDTWATENSEFDWKEGQRTRIFPIPPNSSYTISSDPWLTVILTDARRLRSDPRHGTNILGILKSKFDGPTTDSYSCRGIVPDATYRFASAQVDLDKEGRYPEGAVLESLSKSGVGDVILIERGTADGKLPLEVYPPVYELFLLAFRRNVIVVEAAGNGGVWLDDHLLVGRNGLKTDSPIVLNNTGVYLRNSRFWWSSDKDAARQLNKRIQTLFTQSSVLYNYKTLEDFAEQYVNSETGAILVGSVIGNKDGGGFTISTNSSRGSRVKVFAQGEKILTTSYTNGSYVGIGETSGAAAIIAGIVVALQGVAKKNEYIITPTEMKELLNQGIPVRGGETWEASIPNFKEALLRLNELIRRRRLSSAT